MVALVPLGILGLLTGLIGHQKGWWNLGAMGSGMRTYSQKREAAGDPAVLYGYNDRGVLSQKLKYGASPFSGGSKNMNPRVPPPYVAPIPKLAHRIDWKGTTAQIFQQPEFKKSYKRIHQMVYGTPQAQARRGQLQTDWGPAHMKGYPIHQGRTQNWLPSIMPNAIQAEHADDLPQSHHPIPASHFNIGSHLTAHSSKRDLHVDWPTSSQKIVW